MPTNSIFSSLSLSPPPVLPFLVSSLLGRAIHDSLAKTGRMLTTPDSSKDPKPVLQDLDPIHIHSQYVLIFH